MARKPKVAIAGAGRVGGAIGVALAGAGYEVTAAWSRSRAGRQRVHRFLDVPVLDPELLAGAADVVFVSVPDDAIAGIASRMAPGARPGTYFVHTSGGTSISALGPLEDAGGRVGCLHPLQTIPDPARGAEALRGAAVAVTAREPERALLRRIARDWGGRPFVLADEDKPVYHAAAVFASNYLVSSVWAAVMLFESFGIRNAAEVLTPLARASLDNVLSKGGAKALTGPVSRGDVEAVRRHVAALQETDMRGGAITDAYGALARMTAALAGGDPSAFSRATA